MKYNPENIMFCDDRTTVTLESWRDIEWTFWEALTYKVWKVVPERYPITYRLTYRLVYASPEVDKAKEAEENAGD